MYRKYSTIPPPITPREIVVASFFSFMRLSNHYQGRTERCADFPRSLALPQFPTAPAVQPFANTTGLRSASSTDDPPAPQPSEAAPCTDRLSAHNRGRLPSANHAADLTSSSAVDPAR